MFEDFRDFVRDCWFLFPTIGLMIFAFWMCWTTINDIDARRHQTAQEQIACHQVHGTTWTDAEGHSHCDTP
jgi:ABC-type nickel/cobalt efflux system permease component RcnA